jgi:hypothetical protein
MNQKNVPIILIAAFNLFTLLLYVIAPYVYLKGHVLLSYGFVLLNIAALVMGYSRGVATEMTKKRRLRRSRPDLETAFLYLTVFYTFTFLVKYAYLLKYPVSDVSGMVARLLIGVADPHLGYSLTIDDGNSPTVSWSIFFLISIFDGLYFVVGFLAWARVKLPSRVIFLTYVCIEIFYWAGRGTNFGIISLAVTLFLSMLVHTRGQIDWKRGLGYVGLFVFSIVSFSLIMYSRSNGVVADVQIFALPGSYVDITSPLFSIVPEALHTSLLTIFFYITQGYYHMSFAFDMDFLPSWFGGWNPTITSLYSTFGFDVANNTFIQRLDGIGVDPRINWHSAYTWIANDVSFYGVPAVIYLIGYFIGVSWIKSLTYDDFYSKMVFVFLSGFSVFFFANANFIGYYFYSFMFLFPFWIYRNYFGARY